MLSDVWMQDIANLFSLPVVLTEGGDSTLGAAMIVIKHMNTGITWETVSEQTVNVVKRVTPQLDMREAVRKRYEFWVSDKSAQ